MTCFSLFWLFLNKKSPEERLQQGVWEVGGEIAGLLVIANILHWPLEASITNKQTVLKIFEKMTGLNGIAYILCTHSLERSKQTVVYVVGKELQPCWWLLICCTGPHCTDPHG